MSDQEKARVLEEVYRLLEESDMDYVLVCAKSEGNGGISSNFGFKTYDGFRKIAHGLVMHSVSEKGQAALAFISAIRDAIVRCTFERNVNRHLN